MTLIVPLLLLSLLQWSNSNNILFNENNDNNNDNIDMSIRALADDFVDTPKTKATYISITSKPYGLALWERYNLLYITLKSAVNGVSILILDLAKPRDIVNNDYTNVNSNPTAYGQSSFFKSPYGIAVNKVTGVVYVADGGDTGNGNCFIIRISEDNGNCC